MLRTFLRPSVAAAAAVPLLGSLLTPAPCRAQEQQPWRATAGVFIPVDLPQGTRDGTGFTLALARTIRRQEPTAPARVVGSLRYTEYGLTGDQRIRLFSPTVEYERYLSQRGGAGETPEGGLLAGVGAGAVWGDNSAGGSTRHFAYSLYLGYAVRRFFADARLLRGMDTGEHGVAFSLGGHF